MSRRLALIIGNSVFRDPALTRLLTPDADVGGLADVLLDPEIGAFDDVKLVVNMAASTIRRSISEFYSNKTSDDLLLLYFSGHGVLDEYGRLYLATKETERSYLRGTAIPTSFITDEMDHSRSRRQVLVLDCCHSGAFARGSKGITGASVGTAAAFEGKGYGRVVLTASDATQYAWEGDQVIGEAENSVFTHYLIEGMQTGKADTDGDGRITVDELFDYIYAQVVNQTPKQTPGKWSYKEQGEIIIAQAAGPAAPKPVEIELPEIDDEVEAKLKRLYDAGLAAYWLEEWERAAQAFQAIVEARPDYPEVAEKLQEARRQAQMSGLYARALASLESEEWDGAIAALEAVVAQQADYQDAASRLTIARERKLLAGLYDQARSLVNAEKWEAASRVLGKIEESAPDFRDQDGLKAIIGENIARLERQQKVEGLYSLALKQIEAGDLQAARASLTELQEIQAGYAESERLLAKVKAEIERQAVDRRRQEQGTALYRQAQSLAQAGQWTQVLSKMEALFQIYPEFEDSEELSARAKHQIELAKQEGQRQEALAAMYAEAVQRLEDGEYQGALDQIAAIREIDPRYPDREQVRQKAQKKLAVPAEKPVGWPRKTIAYLRAHSFLTLMAVFLGGMLIWVGLNADRIFTPREEPGLVPMGGHVNVLVGWTGVELQSFEAVLDPFREATGVDVEVESDPDYEIILNQRLESGNPPDIASLPRPSLLVQYWQDGRLVNLPGIVNSSTYNKQYPRAWTDLVKLDDGAWVAVPVRGSIKGLVWYNPKVWQANNLPIPATWDEMLDLSRQIIDRGSTPWCIAEESGPYSGWPGTDWIENILLRQSGEQIYNDWSRGKLPWTSPEIKQAWLTWGQIVSDPNMIHGGTENALSTYFLDVGNGLFTDPPDCYMAHQGSFMAGLFSQANPGVVPGEDFDFFNLPPFATGDPVRLEVSADLFGLFSRKPQAEALMDYLVSLQAQEIWVSQGGGTISANRSVPLDAYPDPLSRKIAEHVLNTDVAVFDASDMMPPELTNQFYGRVMEYIRDPQSLDMFLQELEVLRSNLYP